MLEWTTITCPYCGEIFETAVDYSTGDQHYVEDCQICCNPILFSVHVDLNGDLVAVDTRRENE